MTNEQRVNVLYAHQCAIEMCNTFEAYKNRQIEYLKLLIKTFQGDSDMDQAVRDFIDGAYS